MIEEMTYEQEAVAIWFRQQGVPTKDKAPCVRGALKFDARGHPIPRGKARGENQAKHHRKLGQVS